MACLCDFVGAFWCFVLGWFAACFYRCLVLAGLCLFCFVCCLFAAVADIRSVWLFVDGC